MPLARIVSPALLDARGIPADAWFPVLSSGDIPTPAHYLWVDIDARPSLIWSGHLRLEGDPDPQVRMRNRVRAACRRAAVLPAALIFPALRHLA